MKRIAALAFAIALSGIGTTAVAQQKGAARGKSAKAGATATPPPRVRNYDFDADLIDGELVRPTGEFLAARRSAEHGSLIRVRTDFIREIVKSAEDL